METTDSRSNPDCDCAFVEENTSTNTYSQIWRSSNNYLTVSNEGGSRATAGSDIVISGQKTGFHFGEIEIANLVFTYQGVTYDWMSHDISALDGGDSGAPIGDADASDIEGIVKGNIVISGGPYHGTHHIASAWEELDSDFTLSLQ